MDEEIDKIEEEAWREHRDGRDVIVVREAYSVRVLVPVPLSSGGQAYRAEIEVRHREHVVTDPIEISRLAARFQL